MSLKDRLNSQTNSVLNNEFIAQLKEGSNLNEATSPVISGLGILDAFFVDENLNSIYVSGAKNIYVERKGIVHKSSSAFRDNIQLINLIKKNASQAGVEYNENNPYIQFNYKEGINVKATLPPISNAPVMFIKKYNDKNSTIKSLQNNKAVSKEIAMILEALMGTKLNILIAGNPQSLKTSFLSALSKAIPLTERASIVDFKNEIKIKINNCINYDFSILENENTRNEILNLIFSSNPDKLIFNDCDDKTFYKLINRGLLGTKGIITSIEANSIESALNNASETILKCNPNINYEIAKNNIYKVFDIIILCNKDEYGNRILEKISEIRKDENQIKDIFYLNKNREHVSTGYIPEFYNLINTISINSNIFDAEYKHTYSQISLHEFQENAELTNLDPKENDFDEKNQNYSNENNIDNVFKKAQEKFEELKRNAKNIEFQKEEVTNFEHNEENHESDLNE